MRIFISGKTVRTGKLWYVGGSYLLYKKGMLYNWAFSPLVF